MSGMDMGAYFAITHRTHDFCNPLSVGVLERALAFAGLQPGERAADLGAGNAAMAIHLAERHGLVVDAVEQSPAMMALAEARLRSRQPAPAVTLHRQAAHQFLQRSGRFDLILVMGAFNVAPGADGAAGLLAALKAHLEPGGRILFGDPFFSRPPSQRLRQTMPHLRSFAEYARSGQSAGLTLVYATESTRQDWDEYAWRMSASFEAYAREHPEDPQLGPVAAQLRRMGEDYLDEARDGLGFGLFLFRL